MPTLHLQRDSVKEIAYRLGFTDNTYFTRLFTNTVGVPPNKFRDNID
ncbi:MAG: helix-turn-helix domain-containing protein [Bacteroides sp.]|nr:helix-turn-helix domain-containing protein [Bacteroides sp.]